MRSDIRDLPETDLHLLSTAIEHEQSRRARVNAKPRDQVRDALAGFLDNISFDYFCTFTTRKPVSLFATRRIAEKVCSYVSAGHSSSVFWAAEEFDVRDGFHFHALMKFDTHFREYRETLFGGREIIGTKSFDTTMRKQDVFNWYFQKYGRCQLIDNREPDRQLRASHYVSKYITKKITDYDFRISPTHMR